MQQLSSRRFVFPALFLTITFTLFAAHYWYQFITTPLALKTDGLVFEVKPGTTMTGLAYQLKQLSILKQPKSFVLLGYLRGDTRRLQVGEYRVVKGMRPIDLLDHIVAGAVILHPITFAEGLTFRGFRYQLAKTLNLTHTLSNLSDKALMKRLGSPYSYPEGLFFPSTYLFRKGDSDMSVLRQAYVMMQMILKDAWKRRAEHLPYDSPYEALIVASLIEKETHLPKERSKVSGIIMRRLKRGMRLQIDPAIIYTLGDRFKPPLEKKYLSIQSPYNTYLHKGLPPTPIAMPGQPSIFAALHPDESQLLYFVAKGDGSHVFSKTLQGHRQAIRQYQDRPIKSKKRIKMPVKTKNKIGKGN